MSLKSVSPLARAAWISACHFHDVTEREVLQEVAKRVKTLLASSKGVREAHPLVLFDLDSTLYEVGPRTHLILKEWTQASESHAHAQVRAALLNLQESQVGYSIGDTLLAIGLELETEAVQLAMVALKSFWGDRFFTNAYLPHDRAYPGAAEFVRHVYELGAEIVYLTGRDEPGMGEATRSNLIRDEFPWSVERTHLLMKAAFHLPDLEHKVNAAKTIRGLGSLVASFENEPANIDGLYQVFPDAMHVFMDTVYSEHCGLPRQGLYRLKGFQHD